MAKQNINLGTVANDGTGDTIRDSFDKCNDNFDELYAADAALGSAAAEDVGAFATAAQGATADTAVQPGDIGTMAAEANTYARSKTDATLTFADPLALNANTVGLDDTRRVTATGNFTLPAPTNGAAGQRIRYHILASGGARTITLGSIVTPTGVTFDGVIASGETRVIEIEKNGSAWWMTKNLQFA